MITLRTCYKLLLALLQTDADVDRRYKGDEYPTEWWDIVKHLDRVSLFAMSRVANDYERQAEIVYGLSIDYNEPFEGESKFTGNGDRSYSSAIADFLFELAHKLPANSRRLKGANMVLFFWYLNDGGYYNLLDHYETQKRAYEVLAIIHDLEPTYVEKKYKSYKYPSNRVNGKNAFRDLFLVMSALPEEARLQVSKDYVTAVDKSRGELPEAYTGRIYKRAKEYIIKN